MSYSSPYQQKVYTLSNPFLNDNDDFNFGTEGVEALYEPLFFVIVVTEATNEAAPEDTFKELIKAVYPDRMVNVDEDEQNYLLNYSVSLLQHIEYVNNDKEWLNIYHAFGNKLTSLSKEDRTNYFTSIARIAFILKKTEGMEELAEKYTYRMSNLEKFIGLSKQEMMKLFEDAKSQADLDTEVIDISSLNDSEEESFDFGDDNDEELSNADETDFDFGNDKDDNEENSKPKSKSNFSMDEKITKLKELKELLDSGIIDQQEFNTLKAELMGK
jgi:hypothetical protein